MIPRFFLPDGHSLDAATIALDGEIGRQLTRVLRARAGDTVVLLDGAGGARAATIVAISGSGVEVAPGEPAAVAPEPAIAVTLFAAVLKGERQDWLVQKAVELGVRGIQPLLCARGVARPGPDRSERWRRIAREAAEQCERGIVPEIGESVDLMASNWTDGPAIVCTERRGAPILRLLPPGPGPLALFVGPEGGWDPAEEEWLGSRGATAASLGPRILRAETASLAALAAIAAAHQARGRTLRPE